MKKVFEMLKEQHMLAPQIQRILWNRFNIKISKVALNTMEKKDKPEFLNRPVICALRRILGLSWNEYGKMLDYGLFDEDRPIEAGMSGKGKK